MKYFAILSAALVVFLLSGAELEILSTTDLHGRLETMPQLGYALRSGGKEALRIDCGDTVQGSSISRHSGGEAMVAMLNLYGYDIWVPGNHDYEFGRDTLLGLVRSFRGTVLAADWVKSPAGTWKLFERNGVRCAVIGMTEPKMSQRVLPEGGFRFRGAYSTLAALMPEVRAVRPDVVVLAWHNGLYSSVGSLATFLRDFPEIDLVLGAHSHEEHPGQRVGHAWYVQPGAHAAAVARIRIEVNDDTRKILRIRSELLRPDPERPDPEALRLLEPCRAAWRKDFFRPFVRLKEPLRRPKAREYNAVLGRIGGEALRRATGAEAAFFSVRTGNGSIGPEVTHEMLFQLIPYENRVCMIELSGKEFRRFVEEQFELARRWKRIPRFTGVTVSVSRAGKVTGVSAPERLTLALTDYALVSSRVLKPLLAEPGRKWKVFPFTEREAFGRELLRVGLPLPSGGNGSFED